MLIENLTEKQCGTTEYPFIVHNRPCLDEMDAKAAYETVISGWVARGTMCQALETSLAHRIYGSNGNAVVCVNGSSAIYLALVALGIDKGDEVIIPTYACTALLNALFMISAIPVLVDIDQTNLSLTPEAISKHVSSRTKAIIVVHTYGIPCEVEPLRQFNIPIIEDCSQALGSSFADRTAVGSTGDLSVFSFHATKLLTGGNGGAVLSQNESLIASIRDYLDFDAPESYRPRFNFQLPDVNAAIIAQQLAKIEKFLTRRKIIAECYLNILHDTELIYTALVASNTNYFRFFIKFDCEEALEKGQQKFAKKRIGTIIPLESRELLHRYLGRDKAKFPEAELASKTLLSLPVYPCLSDRSLQIVSECLKTVIDS